MTSCFLKSILIATLAMGASSSARAGGKFNGGPGSGAASAETSAGLGGVTVGFSSASNQVLPRSALSIAAATLTLSASSAGAVLSGSDLRITVPEGAFFTWDSSVTGPAFGGAASNKMGAAASYENQGRTVVLDVMADFAAGDSVTVGGLAFTNLIAAAVPAKLSVDLDQDGKPDAYDTRYVSVRVARPGGVGDGYGMAGTAGDASLYAPGGTLILVR